MAVIPSLVWGACAVLCCVLVESSATAREAAGDAADRDATCQVAEDNTTEAKIHPAPSNTTQDEAVSRGWPKTWHCGCQQGSQHGNALLGCVVDEVTKGLEEASGSTRDKHRTLVVTHAPDVSKDFAPYSLALTSLNLAAHGHGLWLDGSDLRKEQGVEDGVQYRASQ
eukprot:946553-Amphidinium_carterae.1